MSTIHVAGMLAALAIVSCTALDSAKAQETAAPPFVVEQAYARATPPGAPTGAAYMTIQNTTAKPDRLVGGSSLVCDKVQIHEMAVVDGVMHMREVEGGLAIPAQGSKELKPGGYHVMLIGLHKALVAGQDVPLTLKFAGSGNLVVKVPVRRVDQSSSDGMSMDRMRTDMTPAAGGSAKP